MANLTTNQNSTNLDPALAQRYCDIIKAIKDMMDAANFCSKANDEAIANYKIRENDKTYEFPLEYHVKKMVYATLSNQTPWRRIDKNKEKMDEVFKHFNIDELLDVSPDVLVDGVKKLKCGNVSIRAQMKALADNIKTLQRIDKEQGGLDKFYNSLTPDEAIKAIAEGEPGEYKNYKLKQLGPSLAAEYLKNMGINTIKPSGHIVTLLYRLDLLKNNGDVAGAREICHQMAHACQKTDIEIDTLLWTFCAKDEFEFCTANPQCLNGKQCALYSLGLCKGKK